MPGGITRLGANPAITPDQLRMLNQGLVPPGMGDLLLKTLTTEDQKNAIPLEADSEDSLALAGSAYMGSVMFANSRLDGFVDTATYETIDGVETLTGAMPANFDGLSTAYISTSPPAIKTVFIGDAGSSERIKNGVYQIKDGITSSSPNLVLEKLEDWTKKSRLVFIHLGTSYAGKGFQYLNFNHSVSAWKGSDPWSLNRSPNFPAILCAKGIYTTELAGGTFADSGELKNFTLSGLGTLPATHGYTPSDGDFILLTEQSNKLQNGYWYVVSAASGNLSRITWHHGSAIVKRNHLVLISDGDKANTLWRAESASDDIDPETTTDLTYEQVGGSSSGQTGDVAVLPAKMIHRFVSLDGSGNPQNTGRYNGLHLDFSGTPPSISATAPDGASASLHFDGLEKAEFQNPTELPLDDSRSWLLNGKVYIPSGGALWLVQRSSDGDTYNANGHKMIYLSETRINYSGYGEGDFYNDFPSPITDVWALVSILYDRHENELLFMLNGEVLGYHSITMRAHNTGDVVCVGTTNSGWMSGKEGYLADLEYREW